MRKILHEINTKRLTLRQMTEKFLEASLEKDAAKTENLIKLKIPDGWFNETDIIKLRLGNYRDDPAYEKWGLRAIGLRETGEMVGYIGFHTRPDPKYLRQYAANGIEFGYVVFSGYRRRGFAFEAISGLMNWASEERSIENFVISVSPENLASTALAKKLGFERAGEAIDEIDGLEIIYALKARKNKYLI